MYTVTKRFELSMPESANQGVQLSVCRQLGQVHIREGGDALGRIRLDETIRASRSGCGEGRGRIASLEIILILSRLQRKLASSSVMRCGDMGIPSFPAQVM